MNKMKMRLCALLCALLLCIPQTMLATQEARLEALGQVTTQLEKGHAALFDLVEKADWEARKQELQEKAVTLDDLDFSYALMELVASLHDSHTQLYFSADLQPQMQLLPLQVYDFEGELRLLAAPVALEPYLGYVLTAIDGTPIEQVYERMSALLSYDNPVQQRSGFAQYVVNADALHYLGLIADLENIELTLTGDDGLQEKVTVRAYNQEQRQSVQFASVTREATPIAEQAQSVYQMAELSGDVLLVSYYACMEDPELSMKDFARDVQSAVKEKGYTRVIVDLRYNGGGNSAVLGPLVSQLKSLQKKEGTALYTLIGNQTFSSALMNAVQLRDIGAVLVGRPTGGSVNHYGELASFDVPSLSLSVYHSTKHFVMDAKHPGGSLLPQVEIPFTYADYIAGVDADVEYVLQTKN